MYLQKVISKKNLFFLNYLFVGILKVNDPDPHPDPDPLVRGMDPLIQIRIRIHTKMSWIRNTARFPAISTYFMSYFLIGYKTARVLWCPRICCLSTTPASSPGFLCSFLFKFSTFTSTLCLAFSLVVYIVSCSLIGLCVELSSLYPVSSLQVRLPNYALIQHTSDKLIILIM